MKEILETIIKSLVDNPEKISINEVLDGETIVFEVKVDETDTGKIIGKQGKIAKAIRIVMKSAGMRYNKKVSVKIVD